MNKISGQEEHLLKASARFQTKTSKHISISKGRGRGGGFGSKCEEIELVAKFEYIFDASEDVKIQNSVVTSEQNESIDAEEDQSYGI